MSNFPKTIPAFTVQVPINPANSIGKTSPGLILNHVSFVEGQGKIQSEPGYDVKLDATWLHGSDYIKVDADGEHARMDADGLAKDAKTGGLARFKYTGVISLAGAAAKVLGGKEDAKTTEFGELFMHVKFEAGSDEYKILEDRVFVGSGRFILEQGKPVIVEYKVSQVSV